MPIWPLVMGVSRMKMMPGTRIRPEKRKNQLRFPMMSNTSAVLPSGETSAHRSGLEFFVAHAEEPGLLGGLSLDNEAQERPRHGHGSEHRCGDTDDQDQREAFDGRRSAEVQDRSRDQRRDV